MKNRTRHFYEGMARLSEEQIIASSKSHDGYTREAAIIWLSELNQVRFMPIFLTRANDWIEDISLISKNAILDLLTPENVHEIIRFIPQIFHLEKCQRHSHINLLNRVKEYLLQPEFRQFLLNAISSTNIKLATIAFELISGHNQLSLKDSIVLGLKSRGVLLAKKSLVLSNHLSDDEFLEIKDNLINHRSSYVASRSLKRIITIDPTLIDGQLTNLLFHRSRDIRLMAQNRCFETGIRPDEIYLKTLKLETETASKKSKAIQGISEVQKKDCLPIMRNLLHKTEINQIHKTSIEVISRLLMEDAKPEITSALLSRKLPIETLNSISKICKMYYISYSWSELLEIYSMQNSDINFIFKLSLIGSKWNSLIFYLKLFDEFNINFDIVNKFLWDWSHKFNKQHLNPTQTQKHELGELFKSVLPKFSYNLQDHIQFITKSFL